MGGRKGRLIAADEKETAIALIKDACTQGARKAKACELLNIPIRTVERWEKQGVQDKRKAAARSVGNKLSPEEEQMIFDTINSEAYRDLPPTQIVPHLADQGKYIGSESTIYRLLRKAKQLKHRQASRPAKHNKPKACHAAASNQLWSWDITYLSTNVKGQYFYLYLVMDVYSRKIVGWHIKNSQNGHDAAKLMEDACKNEGLTDANITLHSDNGTPMKSATLLAKLQDLGIMPSFSRPSNSDDNPYSESLFKTLKYRPNFPRLDKFTTIEEASTWTHAFVQWYNTEHKHSGLKFVTPEQRHTGQDTAIFENRKRVYQNAKNTHPERWSGSTRNWIPPKTVSLNPDKKERQHSE